MNRGDASVQRCRQQMFDPDKPLVRALDRMLMAYHESCIFEGWERARSNVVELLAEFYIAGVLWGLYAIFSVLAELVLEPGPVRNIVGAVHSCSAIASFSLVGGMTLLKFVQEMRSTVYR